MKKHRAELEAEIAVGSGPRIYDLAILANCQDVPNLGRRLHKWEDQFFKDGPRTPEAERRDPAALQAAPATSDEEAAQRIVRFMEERRELRCLDLDRTRQRMFTAGRREIGPWRGPTTARGGTP